MAGERKKFTLRGTDRNPGSLPQELEAQLRQALNPQQVEAVLDFTGHQLVLAGAGTGKTRTLVWRVAALVGSGVPADQILLMTFTRKAAQEMLHRVGAILGQGRVSVQGGTFHSWAATTLRRHGSSVGLGPSFTIIDSSDAEDLIGMLRTRMGYGGKERRFLQKGSIAHILSRHSNTGTPIAELIAEEYPRSVEDLDDVLKVRDAYITHKRAHQQVDYDDLMTMALELLEKDTAVLDVLRKAHRYILVDEFQDTNSLQARIAATFAGDLGNLTVVGDECQGIYSFRGADPQGILRFPDLHPLTKVHSLTHNYRSTQPILNLANGLMAGSAESFGKVLESHAGAPGGSPQRPILAHCASFEDQAAFVAERIRQLGEEGVPLGAMAVLFRSSSHSAELEIALQRKQLPFRKFGGIRFVEASHVKDLVAMLRIVGNPRDSISWERVLKLIPGIGSSTAQALFERMEACEHPYDALREKPMLGRKYTPHLEALATWLTTAKADQLPALLLDQALPIAKPWIEDHYHDDSPRRLSDLATLVEISRSYNHLDTFLSELSLDPPEHTGNATASIEKDEYVTVSTVHSAKGLEWTVVFIISLLEGFMPSYFSLNSEAALEEERRLLYVAITRAQRELYCCVPENAYLAKSKIQEIGIPSRFLDAMDEDLFEHWDIENN